MPLRGLPEDDVARFIQARHGVEPPPDLAADIVDRGVIRDILPAAQARERYRGAVQTRLPGHVLIPGLINLHTHAAMANRYAAGAARLPFGVMRGATGTDLKTNVARITCPFTGEELTAVPALRPDVGIVHAQRADRKGNVQLWGIVGIQKEVVLAAQRSLVTVEEIVDELEPRPNAVVLPNWAVTAVAEAPRGAHPSYAHSYYDRDNDFYKAWDPIARDRDTFKAWMEEHVLWSTAPTR